MYAFINITLLQKQFLSNVKFEKQPIRIGRLMPGSHYAIFFVKTSVVRLNDERRKSCDRSHYTTARDSLAHTAQQKFSVGDIRVTAILVD